MRTHKRMGVLGGELLVLVLVVLFPATGQGMQNVIHSRSRLFPAIGPGVSSLKRDAAGRYYVLAEPASTILIFDSAGRAIERIPNANSLGATIHYAVSIDLDSHGWIYVADRGDNAVKIFASSGALIASVPVTAPTSVVALSDGQFAITKLQSKRLVEILDQSGATIRTFGDPADEPGSRVALQRGPGNTSATSPPVMDRGRITGDSSGNIYFSFTTLADPVIQRFDRYGYSAYDSAMPASEFGALAGHTGRDIELGYTMSGLTGPATVTAWTDLHSVETSASTGSRRGVQATGRSSSAGFGSGGTAGPFAADSSTPAIAGDSSDFDGQVLSYDAESTPASLNASLFAVPGLGTPSLWMPGMMGMGVGDPFRFGGMHGGGGLGNFGGEGLRSEFFSGRPPDSSEGFGHFHPGGFGTYRATGMLRVGLDDPSKHKLEKPAITAVGVDPQTQEAWAAIGDMLAHLDRNGNLLDTYYVTITGDIPIRPTAILVEADRILMASDPWGIYEFSRPDKPSPLPLAPQGSLLPQQPPAAPPP
ncbi:MAG TPA: hypothetical protein VEI55_01455 [Candidatus Acidoferrum sp.]|nr:hypothetical protein [Candidatus Acidoferrum sp.]